MEDSRLFASALVQLLTDIWLHTGQTLADVTKAK